LHNFLPFINDKDFGILSVVREEEFAPVKNADGIDSPESARNLIYNLHRSWIKNSGGIIYVS